MPYVCKSLYVLTHHLDQNGLDFLIRQPTLVQYLSRPLQGQNVTKSWCDVGWFVGSMFLGGESKTFSISSVFLFMGAFRHCLINSALFVKRAGAAVREGHPRNKQWISWTTTRHTCHVVIYLVPNKASMRHKVTADEPKIAINLVDQSIGGFHR